MESDCTKRTLMEAFRGYSRSQAEGRYIGDTRRALAYETGFLQVIEELFDAGCAEAILKLGHRLSLLGDFFSEAEALQKASQDLRECPFCGVAGADLLIERASNFDYRVVCVNGHKAAWCETPALAVFNWNRAPRRSDYVS